MILPLMLESLVSIDGYREDCLDGLWKVQWGKIYHMLMFVLSPSLMRKEVHNSLHNARRNIGNRSHFMREELHNIVDDVATRRAMLKMC